jgi:hypothetical protein
VFAPLNEIVDNLSIGKRNEWQRLWMMSGWRTGPIHPLKYPHPITQKKMNFWMWILYCFLFVHSFGTPAVKCFWNLQGINKASLFLRTIEKSSQIEMQVTYSTEVSSFLSYSPSMLMHLHHLGTSLIFLSWLK